MPFMRGELAPPDRRPAADPCRSPDDIEALVHDLIGQLTAISGAAQLLRKRIERASVEPLVVDHTLDDIAARTRGLGEQLRLALDPLQEAGPCSLAECVDEVVATLAPGDRRRVAVHIEDRLPAGPWPRWLITTVVRTLVDNALRYSVASERIDVVCERVRSHARLTVRDRGIGFERSMASRLFRRGYRSPSARRLAAGLGVGLYACRRALRRVGGDIRASSAGDGSGATFVALLPLRRRGH